MQFCQKHMAKFVILSKTPFHCIRHLEDSVQSLPRTLQKRTREKASDHDCHWLKNSTASVKEFCQRILMFLKHFQNIGVPMSRVSSTAAEDVVFLSVVHHVKGGHCLGCA